MNFVIRNLGWILLIIFFVFMLYLISNQNNAEKAQLNLVQSGALEEIVGNQSQSGLVNLNFTEEDTQNKEIIEEITIDKADAIILEEVTIEDDSINVGLLGTKDQSVKVSKLDGLMLDDDKNIELGKTQLGAESVGFLSSVRDFFNLETAKKTDKPELNIPTIETKSGAMKVVDEALIEEVNNAISKGGDAELDAGTQKEETIINFTGIQKESGLKSQISSEAIIGKGKNNYDILENFKKTIGMDQITKLNNKETDSEDIKQENKKENKQENKQENKKDKKTNSNEDKLKKDIEIALSKTAKKEKDAKSIVESKKVEPVKTQKSLVKTEGKKSINTDTKSLKTGEFSVGVDTLKLNNAWFTEKLGTVYRGDRVKQLTDINKYGCFKIEVLQSRESSSVGKIAWACKYYMEGYTNTLADYTKVTNSYYSEKMYTHGVQSREAIVSASTDLTKKVAKVSTPKEDNNTLKEVGTIHSVKVSSLKLNNAYFNKTLAYLLKGDKIEQLTNINKYGCFKGVVYKSHNPYTNNKGKIGWVCSMYLEQK